MPNVIPLFTSHYSLGCSILTLDEPKEVLETGTKSIIKLCLENGVKNLYMLENNMSGCAKGLKNAHKAGLNFFFGLKCVVCNDHKDKSTESLATEHKVVLFAANDAGYKRLVKIYSKGATDGFYYRPRIDYNIIKEHWNDADLGLAHPYYYSFLHRNLLYAANCTPACDFTEQVFLTEQNDLPFNYLINDAIRTYAKDKTVEISPVKSIYYQNRADFKSYLSDRSIHERQTLNCPNLEHCSTNDFSFEAWKEIAER